MFKSLLIITLIFILSACGSSPNNSKNSSSDTGHLLFLADKNEHFDCIVRLTFQQPNQENRIEVLNAKISFSFGSGQKLGGRTLDLIPGKTENFEFSQTFSCDKLNIEAKINHCRIGDKNLECPEINISGDRDFNRITLQANR